MKIISFGDVHMATENLERMRGIIGADDLVIVSGDLTNFGGERDASKVLAAVRGVCRRILAVPGNLDRREVVPFLEHEEVALHGRGLIIDGLAIFGCGGSNVTPFNTPFELSEDEIYDTLMRGYREVQGYRPLIMICHTPPYDTKCDRLRNGRPVGSTAARRFIEEVQPDVCVCGHIHESPGEDRMNATLVFNAGPFKGGGYVVIEPQDNGVKASLQFL
jgi:Icc-related predicted phosphoesterase